MLKLRSAYKALLHIRAAVRDCGSVVMLGVPMDFASYYSLVQRFGSWPYLSVPIVGVTVAGYCSRNVFGRYSFRTSEGQQMFCNELRTGKDVEGIDRVIL